MSKPIVVVGAGLAGLVCARTLRREGLDVRLMEAADRPGGKMRTDIVEGFRLDRGFQVFLTAYEAACSELDTVALRFGKFEHGAWVRLNEQFHELHRDDWLHMALSRFLPMADKIRVLTYTNDLRRTEEHELWQRNEITAEARLRQVGFSEKFIDRFARPFFGGVFLDRGLGVSSRLFEVIWKSFEIGDIVLPAEGMQAIPDQIAAHIEPDRFRFCTRVTALTEENERVTGVVLDTGERIEAEAVVVACDSQTAARLTRLPVAQQYLGSTCVWFAADQRPTDSPFLILNTERWAHFSHAAVMTNICPSYAESGHLVMATVLGLPRLPDAKLAASIRDEMSKWFPRTGVERWRPLRVDRIPLAQPIQPPGFKDRAWSDLIYDGLFLAGEFDETGSIEGAARSGQRCARAVLNR